jgi:hypothetical protein
VLQDSIGSPSTKEVGRPASSSLREEVTMLQRLCELPDGIDGLRAERKLTKRDCDEVFRPLLQDARRESRRVRLLYEFAPDFRGFTAGAAWEEARVGLNYLSLFERCAIVSEAASLRERAHRVAALVPRPVHVFAAREPGLDWLVARITPHLSHRLIPDCGVVVVEPTGALRPEDFDALARVVDPWIEAHGALRGVVLHLPEFPGWESLGAFIRHVQFMREHQRRVHRVALAADSRLAQIMPKVGELFVRAELKHFGRSELDKAIGWAAA